MVNIPYFTGFYTSQVPSGAGFLPSTVWKFLSILVAASTFSTGAFPGVRKALVARGLVQMKGVILFGPYKWLKINGKLGLSPL